MVKRWMTSVALTVVVMGGLPAEATHGTYTIKMQSVQASSATGYAFLRSACDPTILPVVNGIDAAVLNVSAHRGATLRINWRATVTAASLGQGVGGLFGRYLNSSCGAIAGAPRSLTPGTWTLTVPALAKWLIVESPLTFDVSMTVS